MEITKLDYAKFAAQAAFQSTAKVVTTVVGLPIIALALYDIRKPKTHPFYDYTNIAHRVDYTIEGASGRWEYWQLPNWGGVTKPYQNLNYGLLGEPSGRWSAMCDGNERSYLNMFEQCALRNPSNGLRYMDRFSCQVDNCDIAYKGDEGPLEDGVYGWNFVKARDKDSGRHFYSVRFVKKISKTKVFRFRLGFKIEPSHIGEGDRPPARERATFTGRLGLDSITE